MNKKIIREMIEKAEERLESAKTLIDAGHYRDSVSRSYYGILDSARTILVIDKIYPKSHSGTISKFNEGYIKTGKIDRRYGHILSKIEKSRVDADYNLQVEFNKKEAQEALAQAREFIIEIKRYLGKIE